MKKHIVIKSIGEAKASQIIREYEPKGLFIQAKGDDEVIGIVCDGDDVWVEEFESTQECVEWLTSRA